MRTIAVIARKGGSGKTTVAVHMALAAHLRGNKVVLADADPQRSSASALRMRQGAGPELVETSSAKIFALQVSAQRLGVDYLFVDTPASLEDEIAHAVGMSDLALLVIRPTFLDFAAAIRTTDIVRRLRRPGLIVFNQAPTTDNGAEPEIIARSRDALSLMRIPVAPSLLRSRVDYQLALENGTSVEERSGPGADEVADLWSFVERMVDETRIAPMRMTA